MDNNTGLTPASAEAHALPEGVNSDAEGQENGLMVPFYPATEAHALRLQRLCIDRICGVESIVVDGVRFFRDIDLGKNLQFSRPRNIRATIKKAIERGEITDAQFIVIDDDDGGQVFYLDKEAGIKLTVGTKGITEEMIMAMLSMVSAPVEKVGASISEEKSLNGYHRTIAVMSKKDTPRAAKLALLPVLEKYARSAGLPIPDVSELIGPAQPRLEGV